MATTPVSPLFPQRLDYRTAFAALRRLLRDAGDTAQVFRIMQALNVGVARRGYARLIETRGGGRIAYERVELAERFSDPAYVARFPPGSVGAAYREFLGATGFSAQGLADVSASVVAERNVPHPYAWFSRRMRDTHDIWHVLTGYEANAPLGEACLVAFSFAQTRGPGWLLIAIGVSLKALRMRHGGAAVRAIWEGYRHGRAAAWLPGEDYESLLAEPIEAVRARLRIATPKRYRQVRALLSQAGPGSVIA